MTPSLTPRLATIKPVPQRTAATMPDFLGPLRSTKRPITAADMPRKKIARLKVIATSLLDQPKAFSSGRLNTLQAYTEPMEIWIPTADAAMSHRFFIAVSLAGVGLSRSQEWESSSTASGGNYQA